MSANSAFPVNPGIPTRLTRRRLLLATAALPLAAALPKLPDIALPAETMTVGEAIAWLHLVVFRSQVASHHA